MDKFPLSLLFCRLSSPRSFSLSLYHRYSSPLIIFMTLKSPLYMHISLVLGSPALFTALQKGLTRAELR